MKYFHSLGTRYIQFGGYVCTRCQKGYIVNDGTWRICTPELCHDCFEETDKPKEAAQ